MRRLLIVLTTIVLLPATAHVQQRESYDYWRAQRDMIQRGQQAIFMCNGLFTSNRTLEQVFAQELTYLREPIGTAAGGDYEVDRQRRAVAIGNPKTGPVMRAAFREGIGCVIMSPDQTFEAIDSLPELKVPPPPGDPATTPWPMGDLVSDKRVPAGVDASALQAASAWAFNQIG